MFSSLIFEHILLDVIHLWLTVLSSFTELKARVQSSRTPKSVPVSPTPQRMKERAPPPKLVWQADEASNRMSKSHLSPPLSDISSKKEISITLLTPKPEGK